MMGRRFSAAFMACLTGIIGQPVSAQPFAPGDGEPTQVACQALGFNPGAPRAGFVGSVSRSPGSAFAGPPPPPPSVTVPPLPVPPAPPAERRLEQPVPPRAPPKQKVETEKYQAVPANPIRQTAQEPVSTFSVDVDTASYANVRRFLMQDNQRPPTDAVRVEELVNYFDYGYAQPADRKSPFSTYVSVTPSPWSSQRQILHIGLQAYGLAAGERPPLNLVFLVDTSGSMSGPDRLPLARQAMNVLIDQLRPQDRVSMVVYAGSAGAVLAPTTGAEKLKIRCALGSLEAGGSTAGGQGLNLAYALAEQNFDKAAVNRVILVTDGDFNVGVADPAKLKDTVADKRKSGVYLSVYGFGRGNYNDLIMQTLAQNGNGTAGYVDSLQEARKLFRDDFTKSLFPIADDVKVQVEFNPAQVSEYRLIGYETRMLANEDFNNDQVDAGEVGAGASVTALYEITPVGAPGSVDSRRYGAKHTAPAGPAGELAFLKIRYKLPGEKASHLIDRPITATDASASLSAAPEPTRWAVAVAAFGQKLRRDPRVSDAYGWGDITALAQGARGSDANGERAEFVQIVKAAEGAQPLNP